MAGTVKIVVNTRVENEDGTVHHEVTQTYPNIAKEDLPGVQRHITEAWLKLGEAAATKKRPSRGK